MTAEHPLFQNTRVKKLYFQDGGERNHIFDMFDQVIEQNRLENSFKFYTVK